MIFEKIVITIELKADTKVVYTTDLAKLENIMLIVRVLEYLR